MNKPQLKLYTACFITLLIFSSCDKLLPLQDDKESEYAKIFSNDSLSRGYIIGIYVDMMFNEKTLLNGGTTLLASLSADDLETTADYFDESPFYSNSLSSAIPILRDKLWIPAYQYIYKCNKTIESFDTYSGTTAAVKNRLIGEVKFIRALCYYYLVNFFGDVPLVLTTDTKISATIPRTSTDKIYQQIIQDLKDAENLLDNDMSNALVTKLASQALLARVYLHKQQWADAEQYASIVINSGKFTLENNLNEVFRRASRETIFQLQPMIAGINTMEGKLFVQPTSAYVPRYSISPSLYEAFEPGDLRKQNWMKKATVSGTDYIVPFKYRIYSNWSELNEYNVVLRLAEQYLIRAEARAMQYNVSGAVEDLNAIRNRAGLPALATNITIDECGNAIEKERRLELFTEWGHRWFDLKRTSRANAILSVTKGKDWESTDQLYPVPLKELSLNPFLTQNPGYF